ncbi:hypothetical protein [Teredinibacter turnerae]|uniref:hypothetical protein n=1 Tax=Teredinibacter turnerae TaxID=2426 RepID=UPI0005A079A5|nr:hypothetical protein [Teredinibacter turnerae]
MSKTLLYSAIITSISLVIMRVIPYFEGYNFDKYWSLPMGVLPVGLISLIVFLLSSVVVIIKIFRKTKSSYNLAVIGGMILTLFSVYNLPIPSYVDGMHKRVKAELSRAELLDFVSDASAEELDWLDRDAHSKLIDLLRAKHLKALSLSGIAPRIEKGEGYISVFYGSALVKHWGYVVGDIDEFPIEHIPLEMQRKVYEGVWVYHDIW